MQNQLSQTTKDQPREDSAITAAKLLSIGITPKGNTGCPACDSKGFIYCKCPPGTGEEDSPSNDDPKGEENNIDDMDLDFDKDIKDSASYHSNTALKLSPENPDKKILSEKELEVLLKLFFNAIKVEFAAFKKELRDQGVLLKDLEAYTTEVTDKGTAIKINIPNAKHYDDFIARLIQKELLPVPTPKLQAVDQENDRLQSRTTPSPFSIKLRPTGPASAA